MKNKKKINKMKEEEKSTDGIIDVSYSVDRSKSIKTLTTYHIYFDEKMILFTLLQELMSIDGKYYKIPKRTLYKCLYDENYGLIRLDLEEVNIEEYENWINYNKQ